jgi:hypothetical protein
MAEIHVDTLSESKYRVIVSEADSQTGHVVAVSPAFYESFAEDAGSPERLLTLSFEFLLEREPKESILREFDVTVIGRYFPEYEEELRRRLRA